ncbi:hypothetical protein X942_5920 [Burkholderia pseudomallei MSHR5596]|nr:hypothetical protein X942_5920 [Burkholderia pseudomallei MSHR5596]
MASHGGWLYHHECNDAGHAHLLDALACNLQHRLFLLPAQPAYFCVPALACVFQLSAVCRLCHVVLRFQCCTGPPRRQTGPSNKRWFAGRRLAVPLRACGTA